jgi:HAD superfamily phosphatase (TIGR01681 family)
MLEKISLLNLQNLARVFFFVWYKKKIKCVVFDLDNTLWEGIIGDDGDDVIIKKEVVSFIKELDERGIIISISSKNNFNVAWEKIKQMKQHLY